MLNSYYVKFGSCCSDVRRTYKKNFQPLILRVCNNAGYPSAADPLNVYLRTTTAVTAKIWSTVNPLLQLFRTMKLDIDWDLSTPMSGLYSIPHYSAQHYDELCARHKTLPFVPTQHRLPHQTKTHLRNTYMKLYNLVWVQTYITRAVSVSTPGTECNIHAASQVAALSHRKTQQTHADAFTQDWHTSR